MLRNGLEPWHLLIVAIVVIVLFGSKRLPDTARSLGRSMRILKSEAKALREEGAGDPAPAEQPRPAAPAATAAPSAEATGGTTPAERAGAGA